MWTVLEDWFTDETTRLYRTFNLRSCVLLHRPRNMRPRKLEADEDPVDVETEEWWLKNRAICNAGSAISRVWISRISDRYRDRYYGMFWLTRTDIASWELLFFFSCLMYMRRFNEIVIVVIIQARSHRRDVTPITFPPAVLPHK